MPKPTQRGSQSIAKPQVYVVEDDSDIARLEKHHLEAAGYPVAVFPTSRGVMASAEKKRPGLFLLDIMLPGASGLDLLRAIRRSPVLSAVPVILVTAKTDEVERITGLELGADDYVTKPFSPRELIARISAVMRRSAEQRSANFLVFGDVEIDFDAMMLLVHGEHIPVTTTEFRLLEYLVRHPRIVFSRDQLLDSIWRNTAHVGPRTVDVYVRRIREKIEEDPDEPRYLVTVRRMGYRFDLP